MKIISLKYLEENFSEIVDRAQAGETFLLDTPDGQIALVPDKNVLKPVIEECYSKVVSGEEAKIAISSNSKSDYRQQLEKELEEINNQEMWLAGKKLRPLRPENN